VLAGRSRLEEALVRVNARTFEPTLKGSAGGDASFWVLPAGPLPPNPQGLLSRKTLPQLLEQARSIADVVLVDVPPIGSVNDPVTVGSYVDGVVVIARLNKTTRDDARRTVSVLQHLDTPVIGVVMTDAAGSGDGYYARAEDGGISAAKAAAATPARQTELAG
jgi:non-specific protein-tyrosine kinase